MPKSNSLAHRVEAFVGFEVLLWHCHDIRSEGVLELIDCIRSSWGWAGVEPSKVIAENDFGNLIMQDQQGRLWRLCPEDLYCRVVALNREQFDGLVRDQEFLEDWQMYALIESARARVGALAAGRKYCLKIPGALGGEYGGDNLSSMSLVELIAVSGGIARQIDGLPSGEKVTFQILD